MKLLAKLVLALAGVVYLGAVMAGRVASAKKLDAFAVMRAEGWAAGAGLVLTILLLWLGARRRPAVCRFFSDLAVVVLGFLWLALMATELGGLRLARLWPVARIAWLSVAAVAALLAVGAILSSPARRDDGPRDPRPPSAARRAPSRRQPNRRRPRSSSTSSRRAVGPTSRR